MARQAFLGTSQRTATLVRIALIPARGFESGAELEGVAQFSTRTMRAGISPARAGARNILGHGFLWPGKTEGAHEDGKREGDSGASAAFAIGGLGSDSRR